MIDCSEEYICGVCGKIYRYDDEHTPTNCSYSQPNKSEESK